MSGPSKALWDAWKKQNDSRARAQLLDGYLGLVHHAAQELWRSGARAVELEDLVGAGTLGLVQALEGFEPERGLAFSTYAMPRIRGAMRDEIRRQEWTPRTLMERRRAIADARRKLEQKLGRAPEAQEIAEHLGLDLETFWRWAGEVETRTMVALDDPREEGHEEVPLHERIADPRLGGPDAAIQERETLEGLRAALRALPEREKLVLSLLYFEKLTLREIGEVLHVTESRVSQLHTRAVRRMREWMTREEAA